MLTHYIGNITIKSIRDYILDASITDEDTILLNQVDYDNIILEHRESYNESMTIPFLLLGVLVKEDDTYSVPANRVKVIQNDTYSARTVEEDEPDLYEPIYRCGWCGNVVDYDGKQLSDDMRRYKIGLIEKYSSDVIVKSTHGYCCRHRQNG